MAGLPDRLRDRPRRRAGPRPGAGRGRAGAGGRAVGGRERRATRRGAGARRRDARAGAAGRRVPGRRRASVRTSGWRLPVAEELAARRIYVAPGHAPGATSSTCASRCATPPPRTGCWRRCGSSSETGARATGAPSLSRIRSRSTSHAVHSASSTAMSATPGAVIGVQRQAARGAGDRRLGRRANSGASGPRVVGDAIRSPASASRSGPPRRSASSAQHADLGLHRGDQQRVRAARRASGRRRAISRSSIERLGRDAARRAPARGAEQRPVGVRDLAACAARSPARRRGGPRARAAARAAPAASAAAGRRHVERAPDARPAARGDRGRAPSDDRRLSAQCARTQCLERRPRRAGRPSSPRRCRRAHEGDRRADHDRVLVGHGAVVVVADRQASARARARAAASRAHGDDPELTSRVARARRARARQLRRGSAATGWNTNASTNGPPSASSHEFSTSRAAHLARRAARPPRPGRACVATFASQRPRQGEVDSGIANGGSASPACSPCEPGASRSPPS